MIFINGHLILISEDRAKNGKTSYKLILEGLEPFLKDLDFNNKKETLCYVYCKSRYLHVRKIDD